MGKRDWVRGTVVRKALYILGYLSDEDVNWMTRVGHKITLQSDDILIHIGQPIDALYFVLEGLMVVEVNAGHPFAELQPGEVVGEMSFVDSRLPSATVRAVRETDLLAVPRVVLLERLEEDDTFAAHFYRAIAVYLSYRLRDSASHLGYGEAVVRSTEEDGLLDVDMLDTLHLAGARFDRMLKDLHDQ